MPQLEKRLRYYFPFGFPISDKTLKWLEMDPILKAVWQSEDSENTYFIRKLADLYNDKRHESGKSFVPIQPGQLVTVSIIVDILRYLIGMYCHEEYPGVMSEGLTWIEQNKEKKIRVDSISKFVPLYPPKQVLKDDLSTANFLNKAFEDIPNNEIVAEELILLAISMYNPAFKPFHGLFEDTELKTTSPYLNFISAMEEFYFEKPPFAPLGMNLFECLRAPIEASPDSLDGQLHYIRTHWSAFLPSGLMRKLLLAIDILEEEKRLRGLGPGISLALEFGRGAYGYEADYPEPSAFSRDADWMSNVVLIAKSVYVWLNQLSQQYQREIIHLNDIPDEELDKLARWGFSGLWLIGLWERSSASQRIKQIMGNPEAAPSAYSLYDYTIANDLGGEEAYQNLRERAWKRGIRLASDMVPNHMGIHSRWVMEHPDWFMQTEHSPFPVYQYNGEDLCDDERVTVQIEDGYWDHRDAAVVFKRIDKWTGDVRYIYHGNDGTSMPWNDTAQLNFLLPEVREGVIQTILHVARKFSIIRFDAAMTLAKKHFQRLWYPQPGDGGAIPSRAEYGMTREEFDKVFPKEFWREVVDRVASEVPETLLLAEAFWLMEGYFVRTLGMHRVYNSAFMNMLKMEDNGKYRKTIKNVFEFSPEIAKRFVNFMNNPDELTAVEQFGKGDKYFGVSMMLVTMPGLPMFGHGQIEGFTEKYGMEYRKAYWDEKIDEDLVKRHEREIFPLMRRRNLFSGADNFALYDFTVPDGWVDENVFAYSNRTEKQRALILFNNSYNSTQGWIKTSTAINVGEGNDKHFVHRNLAEALALNTNYDCYYIFRDHRSDLEFIRSGHLFAEEGFNTELSGYQYKAFIDFREIRDTDGSWTELVRQLGNNGVPNVEMAHKEMTLKPIIGPFQNAVNSNILKDFQKQNPKAVEWFKTAVEAYYKTVKNFTGADCDIDNILKVVLKAVREIPIELEEEEVEKRIEDVVNPPFKDSQDNGDLLHIILGWITIKYTGYIRHSTDTTNPGTLALIRYREWLLENKMKDAFQEYLENDREAYFDARLISILLQYGNLLADKEYTVFDINQTLFEDPVVGEYLQFNRYEDILWFNREQLEKMIRAMMMTAIMLLKLDKVTDDDLVLEIHHKAVTILEEAAKASYQVEKMPGMKTPSV